MATTLDDIAGVPLLADAFAGYHEAAALESSCEPGRDARRDKRHAVRRARGTGSDFGQDRGEDAGASDAASWEDYDERMG